MQAQVYTNSHRRELDTVNRWRGLTKTDPNAVWERAANLIVALTMRILPLEPFDLGCAPMLVIV